MAKVTIVLDDQSENGIDGVYVDVRFDPEVPERPKMTLAQLLGEKLIDTIFDNAESARFDKDSDPIQGSGNSTLQ